jgi:hypothetical protein
MARARPSSPPDPLDRLVGEEPGGGEPPPPFSTPTLTLPRRGGGETPSQIIRPQDASTGAEEPAAGWEPKRAVQAALAIRQLAAETRASPGDMAGPVVRLTGHLGTLLIAEATGKPPWPWLAMGETLLRGAGRVEDDP